MISMKLFLSNLTIGKLHFLFPVVLNDNSVFDSKKTCVAVVVRN